MATELLDLPEVGFTTLVKMADALGARIDEDVGMEDFYQQAVAFGASTVHWISADMKAADPGRAKDARLLLDMGGKGWELAGQLLELDILAAHPELLTLLVERMRTSISAALQGQTDPYKETSNRR